MVVVLKNRGPWLDQKINLFLGLAFFFFILSLISSLVHLGFLLLMVPPVYLLREASKYKQGKEGEDIVEKTLHTLSDDYYLLNDVNFKTGFGNIDHIVIGPTGVFVIETKHHKGYVRCYGDKWVKSYGNYKHYPLGSFSKQTKGNALRVREIISTSKIFEESFYVNGIVVFSNPDIYFKIVKPTVLVLKVQDLNQWIIDNKIKFDHNQVKAIAKVVLRGAKRGRARN